MIRYLSDATQACSRSPTNVKSYHNIGHNCAQHSIRDDSYVTQGYSISSWT